MFLCAYTSDDSPEYSFIQEPKVKKRQKKFKPTPEQVEAFAQLAKLREKFRSYTPYSYQQRVTEADSYMLRMADMDIGCSFPTYAAMFGDFNGNESDMEEW